MATAFSDEVRASLEKLVRGTARAQARSLARDILADPLPRLLRAGDSLGVSLAGDAWTVSRRFAACARSERSLLARRHWAASAERLLLAWAVAIACRAISLGTYRMIRAAVSKGGAR